MNRTLILPALVVAFLFGTSASLAGSKKEETDKVLREWTSLAEAGDMYAQRILARTHSFLGFKNSAHKTAALKWLTRAAEQGDMSAQYLLGWDYERGSDVEPNYKIALKWYRLAANQGHIEARHRASYLEKFVAAIEREDRVTPPGMVLDLDFNVWKTLAERGDVKAQSKLGYFYEFGKKVPRNRKSALKWYRLAAEQGDPIAQYYMGNCYRYGCEGPKNLTLAAKWYRRAAEQGHRQALELLGAVQDQHKVEIDLAVRGGDYAAALPGLERLAQKGNEEAQADLGVIYFEGKAVPRDYKTALRWFRLASKQGNAKAATYLGTMYDQGIYVKQDFKKALRWYLLSAKEPANFMGWDMKRIGTMYEQGEGVAQNYKTALRWYRLAVVWKNSLASEKLINLEKKLREQNRAGLAALKSAINRGNYKAALPEITRVAKQGERWAQNTLGMFYFYGQGVPKNYETALRWFRLAADQGSADAPYHLGLIYKSGSGVPNDQEIALKWFRQAADQGSADAQNELGLMHFLGQSTTNDPKTAVEWFRLAAENGLARAQFNLGLMHVMGWGVPKDFKVAWKWIKLAAQQGEPRARKQVDLAEKPELFHKRGQVAYENGDYATALSEWSPLAKRGHPTSQFLLGMMHETGRGVPKDYKTALKWYRLSAEQGFADAQYALGVMYYDGNGVQQDYMAAVKWHRLAAQQGFAPSQFSLSVIYFQGRGVSEDQKAALEWANLAARQGHAGGQEVVRIIRDLEQEKRLIGIEMRQQERLIGLQEEIRQLRREVRRNANSSQRRPFFTPVPADRFIIPMPEFCTWETVNGRQYCLK